MTTEIYEGTRVSALLARAQAELGSNAIVVNIHRSRLPNGVAHFALTAADEFSAMALVSGGAGMQPQESRRVPELPENKRTGPLVIALVGPTGSGKTTTIAKLALNPIAFGGKRVGLLSLDTYRTAGAEQLAIYARTAGIRMERVFCVKDVRRALWRLRKCEVVLVDTPGRGPAKHLDTSAAAQILEVLSPHELHLVLPEGLKYRHAKRMVAEYGPRGVTHLLSTKLDEYPGEHRIEALANEHGLAMRWQTAGQDIPNDILAVSESISMGVGLERGPLRRGISAA